MVSMSWKKSAGEDVEATSELLKKNKEIQTWELYCSYPNYLTICIQTVFQ